MSLKKKRKMFNVDVTLNICSLVRFSSRLQNLRVTLDHFQRDEDIIFLDLEQFSWLWKRV